MAEVLKRRLGGGGPMSHLLAVLGALGLSLAAIFFRLSQVSPATASTFRALYALPLLVFLARRHPVAPRLRWLALSIALPRLSAAEGSSLLLLQPVGSLLWGNLLFGEAPSLRQWLGAAVVIAGLAAVQLWPHLGFGKAGRKG